MLVLSWLFVLCCDLQAAHDGSIGGILSAVFEVPLRAIIAGALILLTHSALASNEGAVKMFWRGTLEFVRVRPADLGR
jgi:hypothetical protein